VKRLNGLRNRFMAVIVDVEWHPIAACRKEDNTRRHAV